MADEEDQGSEASGKNKKFEFRSNMISHACGDIDKATLKKRLNALSRSFRICCKGILSTSLNQK